VIDGKADGYTGCNIFWISDFMEIGLDGDVEIIKELVQEI